MTKLRVGSLFSGIGGFELGLEQAGMEVAWQVEIEPYARRVLAKHWPDVPRWDDVRTFPPDPVEDWAVDLVCGGFPCQPVSLAGQQKGEEDERWLWDDMRRVCDTLKPRWVLAENVPGLLSASDGLGRRGALFGGVVRDLASLGYVVEWHCLPAGGPGGVGAPHKRLRVWIIGHLPDAESLRRFKSSDGAGQEQARPGGAGQVPDADARGRGTKGSGLRQGEPQQQRGGRSPDPRDQNAPDADSTGRQGHFRLSVSDVEEGQIGGSGLQLLGSYPVSKRAQSGDGRREDAVHVNAFRQVVGPAGDCGWWSTQCRLGRATHGLPDGVDECRGWECGVDRVTTGQANRVARLKGLGNAVVPQVVELIGRAILEAEAAQ